MTRATTTIVRGACIAALLTAFAFGCARKPKLTESGFLSDYSNLVEISDTRLEYMSPGVVEYDAFIIDRVEVHAPEDKLKAEDREKAVAHLRERLSRAIERGGYAITDTPGAGVARISVALTDVAEGIWFTRIHPAPRFLGVGTGGAAMEGEALDSLTDEQVGAVVQANPGNQFDYTAFTTLADVKNVINAWSNKFEDRLKAIRERGSVAGAEGSTEG